MGKQDWKIGKYGLEIVIRQAWSLVSPVTALYKTVTFLYSFR